MTLNFTNLSFYTPTALTLTLKGTGTVTKILADVTISGDTLAYSPSAAEKTTLGTGIIMAQVKITAGTEYLKSDLFRLDANDLDNAVLSELTLTEDFATEIAVLKSTYLPLAGGTMTGVINSVRNNNDGAAMLIRHNVAKGTTPTANQAKYIQFNGSGSTGLIGILHNSISTSNYTETDIRAYNNASGATGYSMIRVQVPPSGIGVPQFYQSADATLGTSSVGPYTLYHQGNTGRESISHTPTVTYSAGTNPTVANIGCVCYKTTNSTLYISVRFQITAVGSPNGYLRIKLPTPEHTYITTTEAVGMIQSAAATSSMEPWKWVVRVNSSIPCLEICRTPGGSTFTAASQLSTGYYSVGAVIPY